MAQTFVVRPDSSLRYSQFALDRNVVHTEQYLTGNFTDAAFGCSTQVMLPLRLSGLSPPSRTRPSGLWRVVFAVFSKTQPPPSLSTAALVGFGRLLPIQQDPGKLRSPFGSRTFTLGYLMSGELCYNKTSLQKVQPWTLGTPIAVEIDADKRTASFFVGGKFAYLHITSLPVQDLDLALGAYLFSPDVILQVTSCVPLKALTPLPPAGSFQPFDWPSDT